MPDPHRIKAGFYKFLDSTEEDHKAKAFLLQKSFARQLTIEELEDLRRRTQDLNEEYEGWK